MNNIKRFVQFSFERAHTKSSITSQNKFVLFLAIFALILHKYANYIIENLSLEFIEFILG